MDELFSIKINEQRASKNIFFFWYFSFNFNFVKYSA